jgi:hypothetical protein
MRHERFFSLKLVPNSGFFENRVGLASEIALI